MCKHCIKFENPKGESDAEDDEGDDEDDDEGDDEEQPESPTSPGHHGGGNRQPETTSSSGLPLGSSLPGGSKSTVSHSCISCMQIDYSFRYY